MYKNFLTYPFVEPCLFSIDLFNQAQQKTPSVFCHFHLCKGARIHVLCRYANFILNKIFLHKKVDVQFYVEKNVFFSWGSHL